MNYKIGQFVRLCSPSQHAGHVSGNIYQISDIDLSVSELGYLISTPMGITHYKYNGSNPGWWYRKEDIEPTDSQLMLFEI